MADDFDFYSDEFQNNPIPQYAKMVDQCPFHKNEEQGWYAVFRHADIVNIARDNDQYSVRTGPGTTYADENTVPVLAAADPPLHTKQKKVLAPAFNPKIINAMEEPIRQFTAARLDQMAAMGNCDFMEELADQLPIWVVCKLLDIPFDDYLFLREAVDVMAGSTLQRGDTMEEARMEQLMKIHGYFMPRVEAKIEKDKASEELGDDIVSRLVKGRIDDERIPTLHIISFAQFLLIAGASTTTVAIGSLFHQMMENPDQWNKMKENPSLIDSAIEETLRHDSPVHGLFRTNNEDMMLGDFDLEQDTKIGLMWAAGNLDPQVFEDPGKFDVEREPKILRKHLAFGHGLHTCIGGPLARMEVKVIVEEFLKRFEGLERNGAMVPYPYPTLHGPYKLPVKLLPKAA